MAIVHDAIQIDEVARRRISQFPSGVTFFFVRTARPDERYPGVPSSQPQRRPCDPADSFDENSQPT
jgi:hypothetical protein